MSQKRNLFILICLLLIVLFFYSGPEAIAQNLPNRLIVGYWHNWGYSPSSLLLTEIPEAFDVINIAFAVPTMPYGSVMQFTPDPGIYPEPQDFVEDVNFLQSQGKTVLISIGGANDPINLNDSEDVQDFVSSMGDIITTYGFNGLDIDLEGASLYLEAGDNDFREPTSPRITNFIEAVILLSEQFSPDFILTAAPETAFVQGGYSYYGGIWGAYLPVIHALRDRLTYIHVQHYNTGSMFGRDGNVYEPATADFHVAMSDMLLAGFTVSGGLYFEPLEESQVSIGLPASPQAAGSGYTPPPVIHSALDYIILGTPFGGQYNIADPEGYLDFRGLMTWSINWDVANNNEFSENHRTYLDSLNAITSIKNRNIDFSDTPGRVVLQQNFPNPFNPTTIIELSLPVAGQVNLYIYDISGNMIKLLINGQIEAGYKSVEWNGTNEQGQAVSSGVYFYRIEAGTFTETKSMILLK